MSKRQDQPNDASEIWAPVSGFALRLADAAGKDSDRLTFAAGRIVEELHRLVLDLRPKADEFESLIGLLTEIGHAADARRQEWVLLADLLGLSGLVEEINAPRPAGATPNAGPGPFYRPGILERPLGSDLSLDGRGAPLLVRGRILDIAGQPVSGALIETWQANAEGLYENQDPDRQPEFNLRGAFRSDAQGRFHYRSIRPTGYAVPGDGPVGQLMRRLGLGLNRPAHLHFKVSASGFETLTTQIFDRADPAIGEDALFGVKPELLAEFRALPPVEGQPRFALDLNLVLCPIGTRKSDTSGRN